MPDPKAGEARNDFVARCVPIVMGEGLDQEAAVGKCEGIFTSHLEKAQKAADTALGTPSTAEVFTGMTTQAGDGHKHTYAIKSDGNGKAAGSGHTHEIVGFLVAPAGEDGHVHLLDRVAQGEKVEAEHGLDAAGRIKTALDHLKEHANYYAVLSSVGLCKKDQKYYG